MNLREEEVIGQVRHALALEPTLDAPRINITFIDGQVNLSGVVDDPEQVTRATEVVKQAVPGVGIDNGLTVSPDAHVLNNRRLGDDAASMLAMARDKIRNRPVSVSVEVINGIAHLRGNCSTAKDRQFLIDAVSRAVGVRKVNVDDFEVAPFGSADDIRLGNLAVERLQKEAPDVSAAVKIDVKRRSATLFGDVRNAYEKRRAEDVVMEVPGIKHVHNELRVYQAGERSDGDARAEQNLKHLLSQKDLPMPNIHVFVTGGIVTLDGEVESVDQKREILQLANSQSWATQVLDNLKVVDRRGGPPLY